MDNGKLKLYNRLSFRILVSLIIMIGAISVVLLYYINRNTDRLYESEMHLYRIHGVTLPISGRRRRGRRFNLSTVSSGEHRGGSRSLALDSCEGKQRGIMDPSRALVRMSRTSEWRSDDSQRCPRAVAAATGGR